MSAVSQSRKPVTARVRVNEDVTIGQVAMHEDCTVPIICAGDANTLYPLKVDSTFCVRGISLHRVDARVVTL
ncbi:hypothetical protein MY5147_001005 [Beauveria neobassiana]|uniref:Uncharacterized protein n=1 Tax=Beauveria bassiana D1-5 TaxID=1245745 RepID=A0A0A2VFG7_BEABA|nr:hypothetical protein BBAD15_g9864 [Beauveria bassiana D1-5]